uniref:Tyrosine-protein kinase ephrin type A/B receptor-like domain-containing protein n=1 Tax=Cryptomonas curvata TaxID=233186 RepID=A0A6T8A0N1_9CRYP|mmetsp:Transcript_42303/g.88445  ORF Transcript_42303/g.88445 Transcript_42303/m.88445 type:complete len:1756 (+) Transcript_42303:2551-7818(+)
MRVEAMNVSSQLIVSYWLHLCNLCETGTFQSASGSVNCTKCFAGTFQTGSGMITVSNCTQCSFGTYQTGLGSVNASACLFCSAGKYQTGSGLTNINNCTLCRAGTYQTGVGMINCSLCHVGTYQTGQGIIDARNCSLCSAGTYQTGLGISNSSKCSLCAAGKFQTGFGMPSGNNCSQCPLGSYQTGFGGMNCTLCPAGTYQTGMGMLNVINCTLCPAGTYLTTTGMLDVRNCSLCSPGTFQTGFGSISRTNCSQCIAGTYQTGMGSQNCTLCVSGKYQSGFGNINCSLCYLGTYQTGLGFANCSVCGAGSYQSSVGNLNCTQCGQGTYHTGSGLIALSGCLFCDIGTYQTGSGMTDRANCSFCLAGKYQTGVGMPAANNCSLCEIGKYQTGFGTIDCLMCIPGTYQTGLGMPDLKNCSMCLAGSFQTGLGMSNESNCSLCSAGKYQTGTGITFAILCRLCDPGFYATGMGSINCTFCAAGRYQTGFGMMDAANCSLCKEGLFQTGSGMLNRDSCLPCSPGTYHTGLGMSSPSNCSLCGAGLIQSGIGSVNCSSCGPGTYQTGLGMVSYANCSLCEKGKYQTGTGISNATGCMLCVAGKYQTGIGITDSVLCRNCGPGYFQTGVGMPSQQNCSLCIFGTFQTGSGMYNSSSCGFCSPGTFQTGFGAVNCTHCSAGTFQSGFGIYNESHCSLCKPGTFQTGTGMLNTSDCLLCSSGKYQTGFGLADPKYCSYCKAGSYQTGSGMVSQDSCALCGAGMYQTGNGMSSSINCSLCLAGTYQSGVGNVNCTLCNTGKYQTGSGMMTDLNCTLCYAGKYQTGTGMMNEDSCDLCTAGTYQSGNGMGNESSCKACDAGKYFSGLGNPSAVNCTTGLSPTLKLQAQATTVVVSTVVAMVVSTSVGSAIGASVGGSVASSGGSGGASIFQLIQATQFMNVFGKLIDQKAAKANNARRSEQLSNISESGADENQESAAFEADDAGDASEFSDQFAWANGRFDDIFSLHPDTCAGVLLQPFFGIVGTAVTVIGASFILRALVNLIMTYASSKSEDDETSSSGLGFGVFEYAVVKTAHLGLCQASGYAISTAMYSPTCGSSAQLVWALALCWLLSFPVGFTLYLGYKMTKSKSNKGIKFARKKHAGSWSAYFKKIFRAEGSHDRFCRPHVIHYSLKIFFGFSGALLLFLAISFVSDPNNDIVRTILLFVFGFISLIIAATLSYKPGRNVVVFLTNILAHHVGKRFTIVEGNAVVEQNRDYTETHSIVLKVYRILLAFFVSCMAWIQAKIEVILDPSMLWALRHRGKWVKKDELKVFYSELNDRAIYFAVFLMIKNVIIGITLADNLVDSLRKAWVIAILYCFELLIHLFYSPDVDAINGLKMAAQVGLQTVIMITAALVTSGRVKSRYGEQICIQVSLVQIFLAIPEQIWSVVSMAILRKNGPPREPDFKTTEEEIAVAREKASLTFGQRLQACAVVLKGIKSMTPALKDGDPAGIITELIIRKNMLLSLEKLNGSVLSIIFDDIFHCRSVRQALEVEMKDRPEISPSVIEILGNKWDTSVDFRDGVSHIYKIKDILEGTENLDVSKSPDPQQHGKAAVVNGLHFGLQTDQGEDLCTINERTQADQFQNLQGTPRHWPGYDTSGLNPFESQPDYTKTFQHHDYTTMSPSSNGFYVSEPQQSLFAFSAVSSPELVFYQPIPEDFTLMQFWHSSVSAQVAETDQLSLDEKKYILDHPKRLGGNSFGLMKGVSGSCSEAAKKIKPLRNGK